MIGAFTGGVGRSSTIGACTIKPAFAKPITLMVTDLIRHYRESPRGVPRLGLVYHRPISRATMKHAIRIGVLASNSENSQVAGLAVA